MDETETPAEPAAPVEMIHRESTCKFCRTKFEYEIPVTAWGRTGLRVICNDCREGRKKWLNRRWKMQAEKPEMDRSEEDRAGRFEWSSREVIGQMMGLTPTVVERTERRALNKLRRSTELRGIWQEYVEAGMPNLKNLLGEIVQRDVGMDLMEYQVELSGFWQAHDRLESQALAEKDGALAAAVRQLREELVRCQRLLADQIVKAKSGSDGSDGSDRSDGSGTTL